MLLTNLFTTSIFLTWFTIAQLWSRSLSVYLSPPPHKKIFLIVLSLNFVSQGVTNVNVSSHTWKIRKFVENYQKSNFCYLENEVFKLRRTAMITPDR